MLERMEVAIDVLLVNTGSPAEFAASVLAYGAAMIRRRQSLGVAANAMAGTS